MAGVDGQYCFFVLQMQTDAEQTLADHTAT